MNEIKPNELKRKIDSNDDIFILDVRTPQEFESWKLSYDKHDSPKLIPVDRLMMHYIDFLAEIPKDKEIITICAHGNRSLIAANMLSKLGYNAKSLSGGMAGWNKVYDVAEIPVPNDAPFRIWQIRRISKGCMGYIVSSVTDKRAVVIDPSREIYESFLKVSEENGLQITSVIDTHQHADHVSGVIKLVKMLTAKIASKSFACFSSLEDYENNNDSGIKNIQLIKEGDEIKVGENVIMKVLHTPGHTGGSMSFFIDGSFDDFGENNNDGQNGSSRHGYFLFTGDTLFTDGIGRPDLRDEARTFAGVLYDTYHQKIETLPPTTCILPAHFSVSSIRLKHGVPIFSTIESLKKSIKLLSMNKDEFINSIVETLPPRPVNYRLIISINKKMLPYDGIEIPDLESGPNSCAIASI
jgi:glyoxylase-like metal-dependent hydrolase (beta-lactamase superfamily II)/rhodanese-related sulfurtransferase